MLDICYMLYALQLSFGQSFLPKQGLEKSMMFESETKLLKELSIDTIHEEELLAVVFSLEKFHTYKYGRGKRVQSDHEPLEMIFK